MKSYLILELIRPLSINRHGREVLTSFVILLPHGVQRVAARRKERAHKDEHFCYILLLSKQKSNMQTQGCPNTM